MTTIKVPREVFESIKSEIDQLAISMKPTRGNNLVDAFEFEYRSIIENHGVTYSDWSDEVKRRVNLLK